MGKKFVSVIVILTFVIFSESCIFYRTKRYSTESPSRGPGPKASIVRILLKSGETREFGKKNPAHIVNRAIIWNGPKVTITTGGSAEISREGDAYVITTGDGRAIRASSYSLDAAKGRLTYLTQENPPIPLSEVAVIWTRDANTGLTILVWLPIGLYILAALAWSNVQIFPDSGY